MVVRPIRTYPITYFYFWFFAPGRKRCPIGLGSLTARADESPCTCFYLLVYCSLPLILPLRVWVGLNSPMSDGREWIYLDNMEDGASIVSPLLDCRIAPSLDCQQREATCFPIQFSLTSYCCMRGAHLALCLRRPPAILHRVKQSQVLNPGSLQRNARLLMPLSHVKCLHQCSQQPTANLISQVPKTTVNCTSFPMMWSMRQIQRT